MKLYKFVEPQFSDAVLRGEFRVGTFEDFRRREESDGIGDKDENVGVGQLHGTTDSLSDEDRVRALRSAGFGGSADNLARMRNMHFANSKRRVRGENLYVLCFSIDIDVTDLPDDKSAVIEILDVDQVVSAIANAHPERVHPEIMLAAVSYDAEPVDIIGSASPTPNPFRKRPQYAGQKEYRAIFRPTATLAKPFISQAPLAARYLQRLR